MAGKAEKAAFGIEGLDDITAGGLARGRLYLLEGDPGTGKTTMATEFLLEGVRRGEKCLYITLSETEDELRDGAASPTACCGWRSWPPNMAPSGAGCGSSNIAASAIAAAFTISRSRPGACASSRGSSPPSTAPASPATCWRAARPRSMHCSAAAS